jgi:hypothetical protein
MVEQLTDLGEQLSNSLRGVQTPPSSAYVAPYPATVTEDTLE